MAEEIKIPITDPITALVFGSVPSRYWGYIRSACPAPELVIAADGGVKCAHAAGYTPDLLIGDWDSGGKPRADVPSVTLPVEKDLTDLQAAAQLAMERGAEKIIFTACLGGRLDQTAANLALLEWVHDRGGEAILLEEGNEARFWDGPPLFLEKDERYRFLSILPLDRTVTGVTLEGVKYPLEKVDLIRGGTLTISNEITAERAKLSAENGRMLVIRSQKARFS